MKEYTVYMHVNKTNDKKYIGITSQSLSRRFRNGKGYIHNNYFYSAIIKDGWDNFEHILLYSKLTKTEAEQKEIEMIKKYNTMDKLKGYNITKGGDGLNGYTPTEEQKKKRSKIASIRFTGKGNPFYGKNHNEEVRKKLSEIAKERFKDGLPEETKQKLREKNSGKNNAFYGKHHTTELKEKWKVTRSGENSGMYGRKHKKETIKKMKEKSKGGNNSRARKVNQYTLDYMLIKTWDCMAEAERELDIRNSNISYCCRKNKKEETKVKATAKGFIWEYAQ